MPGMTTIPYSENLRRMTPLPYIGKLREMTPIPDTEKRGMTPYLTLKICAA